MASSNLSIVFGPNILVKRDADPYDTSDFRHVYGLVQLLIDHYEEIFQGIEEDRKQFEENETKELDFRREKERADKENEKQQIKEEKLKKEEKARREKEEKERKEKEARHKRERDEDDRRKKEVDEKERKEKEEREKRIRKELEAEGERDRIRQQLMEEERKKVKDQLDDEEKQKKKKDKKDRKKKEEKLVKLQEELKKKEEEQEVMRQQLEGLKNHSSDTPTTPGTPTVESRKELIPPPSPNATLASSTPVIGPVCDGCLQNIQGPGLQAMGKKWHPECFVCAHCKKPLTASFLHTEGKPYCTDDFQKLFAKKCAGCNLVIQGPFIKAMNREWHPQGCFICSNCGGLLTTGFFEKGGKPFCKSCV